DRRARRRQQPADRAGGSVRGGAAHAPSALQAAGRSDGEGNRDHRVALGGRSREAAPPQAASRNSALTAIPAESPQPGRVLVLLNPAAPRLDAAAVRAAIEHAAAKYAAAVEIVEIPQAAGAQTFVDEHVCRAVREGRDRVVVAGGDGTVSMVAECLARQGSHTTKLGLLASGTTNVLARELGLPLTLEEAADVAL